MSIDVVNETEADIDIASIGQQARFVLDRLRIHAGAELSVVFVDTATMTDLHVRWMDEPGPTDVLSFPMDELTLRATTRNRRRVCWAMWSSVRRWPTGRRKQPGTMCASNSACSSPMASCTCWGTTMPNPTRNA